MTGPALIDVSLLELSDLSHGEVLCLVSIVCYNFLGLTSTFITRTQKIKIFIPHAFITVSNP